MTIFCTERFEKDINDLQKNNSYSSILNDVCDYFSDKSTEELHLTRDIIQNAKGKFSLNKYRIMNSNMNKGKSGSYRCLTVVLPEIDSLFLGTIYPKTGADGIDNLTKEKYKEIASYVKDSISKGLLKKIDLDNKKIIPFNQKS